jgi:phosphatidate cytidylyltransferase
MSGQETTMRIGRRRSSAPEQDGSTATAVAELTTTPRKGGRNLWVATAVGLTMLAGVLAAAWWHPLALAGVLYAFMLAAIVEWRRALQRAGRRVSLVPVVLATLGMGVATWYGRSEGLIVALLVGCAGAVAWRVVDERVENTMADSLASIFSLMWIPFLGSFVLLLGLAHDGWQRVIIFVIAVVGNDTGALFFGMLLGRHKLAPRVSPNKTWEGLGGGLLVGTAAAAVAGFYLDEGA